MQLVHKTLLLLFFCTFLACHSTRKLTQLKTINFYVGTATNLATEGIYAYELNLKTGETTLKHKTTGILNPSFLALSSDNDFLYAIQKVEEQKESGVSAFSIDKKTGGLQLINQQTTKGRGACYVSVDKANENVLIAHYGSGSVTNLPLQKNGGLETVKDIVQHEGSSINLDRQEGPHAHFIRQGIGDFVYAADLGIDKIMLYELENGQLKAGKTKQIDLEAGAGPRHITFHPNEQFLYVMNELGGSVTVFSFDKQDQTFKNLQTISSLPANFDNFNKSADIHVHPSGKFLYASNRGFYDSIAAFKINQETGLLTLIEIEKESIKWPRNFALSPDGKYLLCANLNDDSISIFTIDNTTGALTFSGQRISIPKPLCIKFERFK